MSKEQPDWNECPIGARVAESLEFIREDVAEIKNNIKGQNGRVRDIEINKVDWKVYRDLGKKVDALGISTTKIITAGSVIIALLSLGLLAYKTFAGSP
jgi:NADPH-dependent glutamate synthase beta subunit-like oxidoreductase